MRRFLALTALALGAGWLSGAGPAPASADRPVGTTAFASPSLGGLPSSRHPKENPGIGVLSRADRPTSSPDLTAFLHSHGRLPRLGDVPAPWHHRCWLLPYVFLLKLALHVQLGKAPLSLNKGFVWVGLRCLSAVAHRC